MILISRKVDYGILALCHLAHQPTGSSAREVASRFGISRPFIANILKVLCHQGIVESTRGINGGYRLARPAREILLAQIMSSLDGPFAFMSCANDSEPPTGCTLTPMCPARSPLKMVHDRIVATISKVTLEDLAASEPTLMRLEPESAAHDCARVLG